MADPRAMDWASVFAYQNPPRKSRHDRRLVDWARKVKDGDGCVCTQCGGADRLHSHHIKPKSSHPELRYEVDNGVTLCAVCHAQAHAGNLAAGLLAFKHDRISRTSIN